jgi:aspartate kinase
VPPMATSLRSAAAPRGLAPSTPPASARCDQWLARDRARGTRGLAAAVRGSTRRLAVKRGDGAPDLRGAGAGLGDQLSVVMKFGGSSVSSPARMEEVAGLVLAFPEERPVLVLSAMGKTTNLLLLVLIATYTALK